MSSLLKLILTGVLTLWLAAAPGHADDAEQTAARIAREQYGGRVLKVERREKAYRVKLLQKSGKVRVVSIPLEDVRTPGAGASTRGRASQSGQGR